MKIFIFFNYYNENVYDLFFLHFRRFEYNYLFFYVKNFTWLQKKNSIYLLKKQTKKN